VYSAQNVHPKASDADDLLCLAKHPCKWRRFLHVFAVYVVPAQCSPTSWVCAVIVCKYIGFYLTTDVQARL